MASRKRKVSSEKKKNINPAKKKKPSVSEEFENLDEKNAKIINKEKKDFIKEKSNNRKTELKTNKKPVKSTKTAKDNKEKKIGEKKEIMKGKSTDIVKVNKTENSPASSNQNLKKEKTENLFKNKNDLEMSHITRETMQKSQKWVGAHVSISGGLYKAIEEACKLEANALGLFLRSQRRWESPPLASKSIVEFEKTIKNKNFGCSSNCSSSSKSESSSSYFDSIKQQILPHGSYLINLGNPDNAKRAKSYTVFLDDLKRCDSLSIALYNFHPGSTCGNTNIENSISLIADCINKAHKETKRVKILLENMAGQGNIIGSKFEELASIIKFVHEKSRVGICLDTCHLFAAGYDIRTPDAWNKTLNQFENIIGMKYLSAMHLNDSKGPLGCNKDRHESIGKGHIGIDCFKFIMQDSRFCNMPLILETPEESLWFEEIQLLHSFVNVPEIKR